MKSTTDMKVTHGKEKVREGSSFVESDSFSDSFSKRNSKNKTDHFFGCYSNGIRSDYRTEYKVNEWLVQSVAENKQSNNACPFSSQIDNDDS